MAGMLYTVYKTTNTVNGKIYIGAHQTEDLGDKYLGSGERMRSAIKKYGRASFTKEVLFVFDNPTEMSNKEAELVTREFVDREDTYNLVPGGYQGDSYYLAQLEVLPEERTRRAKAGYARMQETLGSDPRSRERATTAWRNNIKNARDQGLCTDGAHWVGKRHSEETRSKMSATHQARGNHRGEKNPQHGTLWMYSLTEARSKKVRPEDLSNHLQTGWLKGRKMRF